MMVPPSVKGNATKSQMMNMVKNALMGKVWVPYATPTEFRLIMTAATIAGMVVPVSRKTLIQSGEGLG